MQASTATANSILCTRPVSNAKPRFGFSVLVALLFLANTVAHAATIIGPGNQVGNEDTQIGPLAVTVQGAANPNFNFDVFSSNTKLFPNSGIVSGGSGANRTITLLPAKDESGSASIIISVFDGAGATASFNVTVNPVNDGPTLNLISDVTITNPAAPVTITLTGITPGPTNENVQSLNIQASSSDPTLIPNLDITYASPNTTATMTLQPALQVSGTATITVTAKDNGGTGAGGNDTATQTFQVIVNSINHAPSIQAFDPSVWPRDDATLGIAGFVIEDFEDVNLSPGLQISVINSTANFGPTATLPRVFDPAQDDPNAQKVFAAGVWDGTKVFLNRQNPIPAGYSDFGWGDIGFHFAAGVSSFGFSLENMDLATALLVNGAYLTNVDAVLPKSGGRNGYLRIDAGPGQTITNVTVANGQGANTGDGLVLDHVAFRPAGQNQTISDSTFNNSDWDLIVFPSTSQSSASASQASDGNGNLDPYMKITHTLGGGPPSLVRSVHIRKLPYDPRTQGAIESISYSEQARIISTEFNTFGGGTGPALRQNGNVYIAGLSGSIPIRDDVAGSLPSPYKPVQFSNLDAATFTRLLGPEQIDTSQHPDFSSNGAPIEFGFVRANSHTASSQTTRISAIDNISFALAHPAPSQTPSITAQPQSSVVPIGGSITFSVTATGTAPLFYQWRFNGLDIPGVTNAIYTISNVQPIHSGTYSVVVRNAAGSVTSSNATLLVNTVAADYAAYIVPSPVSFITTTDPRLTITNHGIAFTAQQLEAVRLVDNTFLGQGTYHLFRIPNTGEMTVRWTGYGTGNHQIFFSYWNGTQFVIRDIRDAITNQSYEITVNRPLTESHVYILINCTSGQINTDQLAVSSALSQRPTISAQPQNRVAPAGNSATFSVTATGSPPLSYQWRFNHSVIPGATDASLAVNNMQYENAGDYTVEVSNSSGSVTSNPARLTLLLPALPPSLKITVDGQSYEISTESHSPGFYRLMVSTDLATWVDSGHQGFVGGEKTWLRAVPSEDGRFYRLERVEVPAKGTVFVQFPTPSFFGHRGTVELLDANGVVVRWIEGDETGRVSFAVDAATLSQLTMRNSYFGGLVVSAPQPIDLSNVTTPDHAHDVPIINGPEYGLCVSCKDCPQGSSAAVLNQSSTPILSGNVRPADGALLQYVPGPSQTGPFGNTIGQNLWIHTGGTSDGSFGRNVSADFDLRIQRISATVIVLLPGNNQRVYLQSSDGGMTFLNSLLPGLVVTYDEGALQFRVNLNEGLEIAVAESPVGIPGHVVWTRDRNNITTTYERDSCGQATVIHVEETGAQYRFSYTVNPHVKSVTDQLGRTWEYTYDSSNRLVQITSPPTEFADIAPGVLLSDTTLSLENKPRRTTFAYTDPNFPNYLTSITDERGAVVRAITYDVQGRVSTQTINGHITQYIYEPTANPIPLLKLEPGNILTRVIDGEGNIVDTEMMGPGRPGQYGIRRRVTWTESGKGNAPLRSGEPLYYEQRWLQDCNCLTPVAITQPFSSLDKPTLVFDASGIPQNWPRTLYTYNADRQVLAEVYTDGTNSIRTEITYQSNGYGVNNQFARMLTRTEARAFDSNPIYRNLNFVHRYDYDSRGNMTKHTGPIVTRGVSNSQAVVESWTHNQFGQVLTHTDPNGNITVNTYHTGTTSGGNINTRGNFFGFLASFTRGATGSADAAVNLTTTYLINALGQVTRMIDPMGHAYDTDYNDLGEVVRTLEPEVALRNGQTVRYETRRIYDGAGNVVMTRRSNINYTGRVEANAFIDHSMGYDAGNNLLAERREVDANDANDLVTQYAYDRNDQLIAIQKPEGNRAFTVYDERRMLLKQFSGVAPGTSVTNGYPVDKRAVTLAGTAFVAMTRADYDSRGNPVISYDGRGNSIIRGFDFRNRQVFETDQNRNGWVRRYDDAGNVLATDYGAMSATNGVLSQALARNYARFDELGRQYQMVKDFIPPTSELGQVDPANPENPNFLTRFDAGSRTVASLDANGNVTTLAYDAADRRARVTDALNNSVASIYDPNSNVTEIQETELPGPGASGPVQTYFTTFTYDALNRRVESHILGLNRTIDHRSITSYDSRGNTILMQDAEDKFALRTFDDQNRLVKSQRYNADPGNLPNPALRELQRSEFRFDRNGRKTNDTAYSDATTNTSAQITQYFYDHADRRVREVYPDSEDADDVIRMAYDANGNPEWVRDQRGVMFTNVFDPGNRLTGQFIALPASVPGTTRQSFGYDPLNRLTNAANDYAQVGRAYDALSRQTEETQSIRLDGSGFANGWEQPVRVACAFDKQSNNRGCTVTEGTNTDLAVTRLFDALNRVDTISAAYFKTNRPIADYNYYGPGRIQSKTLGNGARMVVSHDAKRRIAAMVWVDPNNLLAGFEYGYSPADNVLFEKFQHDGGRYDHFGYNDRYELTHVAYRSTNAVPPTAWRDSFVYDDNYNRKTAAFGSPFDTTNTVRDGYVANRVNEYTNIVRNNQVFTVQHDRAGNMTFFPVRPASANVTSDVPATARWDAFNCLFDIDNPATGKQHYRYDPFRRRIAVLNSETILQGSRRFIYEGWSDIEERVFNSGATLASAPSRLERIYVEGPRIDEHLLAAIDRDGDGQLGSTNLKNVRDVTADQEYFYLQNRLGSTMALSHADNSMRVLEFALYTAHGEATVLAAIDNNSDGREDTSLDLGDNATTDPRRFSEEYANPFLFTGRRFDDRSGLHYYRFRYYESRSGSFISRDPAGYIDSLNAYAYVLSSPVVYNDPKGLDVTCVGIGGTFAFIVGAGLNLSFCWDECKNWAIVVSASARVGAEVGVGINVLVSEGGLADYISGWSFDFNLGEGIVSGGADRSDSGKQGGHVGIGPGLGASAGAGLSAMLYGDLSKGYPCPPESNSKDIALIREAGERARARAARWARYPDCPKCCEERRRANLRRSDEERERYGQPDFIPLSPGE